MRCETLLQLLNIDGWESEEASTTRNAISAHMHSCPLCQHKIAQLSEALAERYALTCDQCCQRLPTYYEATRPEYPLVELSEVEMTEIAMHLSRCPSCHNIYEELVLLAELEERDEMIEL
jgi:predicted anti-sigma-YlaC factor YlaD